MTDETPKTKPAPKRKPKRTPANKAIETAPENKTLGPADDGDKR
jgi:hypothetical protein